MVEGRLRGLDSSGGNFSIATDIIFEVLWLRRQDRDTSERRGGGQMWLGWNLEFGSSLGPNVDSRSPRRAQCPTFLSDLEGPSSSRVTVARKRSEFCLSSAGVSSCSWSRQEEEVEIQGSTRGKGSRQIESVGGCPHWQGQGKRSYPDARRRGLAGPWYIHAYRRC